jgi:hypothetical protein
MNVEGGWKFKLIFCFMEVTRDLNLSSLNPLHLLLDIWSFVQ